MSKSMQEIAGAPTFEPVLGNPRETLPPDIARRHRMEEAKAAKAKRVKYAEMLTKAEGDLDRWLGKLIRASNQVAVFRSKVKRYKKVVSE